MKEIINYLMQPIISFPAFTIGFFLMLKYYRVIGTKKFAAWFSVLTLVAFGWGLTDPNFLAIILWPDNVPISILNVLVLWSTWFCLYKARINDERLEAGECPVEALPENREKVWCWPNLVYTELFVIIAGTIFLIVWAIIFKAPLEEPANPTWAPNPAKAPWYFLGLQEMLVYFDPWMAGVVAPGVIVVGLILIPYIDTNPKGNGYYTFKERPMAITLFLFGWLVLWYYLIIVGTFLRGPNWTYYGPFEFWDFHKVEAAYNVNLSEYLWIKGLNVPMPGNIIIREILGIILVGIYQFVPGFIWAKTQHGKNLIEKIGYIRFCILVFLALGMASLPIKMVLRWLFNLKYIIAMPEFELNL
ncbi:MAG: hypothetical protein OEY33_01040 [Bdellovibrionales bacterium]|jgi:hypothetical protein|nr:hypothetical protein [Bdellovibrionales bacterium]